MVLLPNMELPVVLLLFEPNMLVPVFALEPNPEAIRQGSSRIRARRGVAHRGSLASNERLLTRRVVVVGTKAAEPAAEGHLGRGVARGWLAVRGCGWSWTRLNG